MRSSDNPVLRMRYPIKIVLAIFLVLSVLSCQLVTDDQEDQKLTLLYWQAPSVPFSYQSAGTKDVEAASIMLEPLANYDPDGNIVPALASEIPTVSNGGVSADHTSITWKLKKDVKWSDGSDMTADDVVFTWVYCTDPETGCTAVSSFDGISAVEAIDGLTVKLTFDAPKPYPYTAFVGSGNPIISKEQFADCLGVAASVCSEQNNSPIGTGPYRIVSFTPNEMVVYERNAHYRGDEPYFDLVELKGGGEALTAAQMVLELGEADYAWNLQIAPDVLEGIAAEGNGRIVTAFSSNVERLVLNQTNPNSAIVDDRSEYLGGDNPHPFLTFEPIQKAMSMAIDRSLISERLYGSAGRPTCNMINGPPNYVSSANDDCLDQDIAGAKQILDDNDIVDRDGDGVREYEGTLLRVVYQTSTNDVRQETQKLVKDWWTQIGIDVEVVHHDASLFFGGDPIDDAEYSFRRFLADVQMYTGGSGIDPQAYLSNAVCDHIPERSNNWSMGNIGRVCDPEYDAAYARLAETPVGPERTELVKQLNDMYVQSYYEIPLINRGSVSAHLNSLKGVRMNAWDSELWNIGEWYR